MKMMSLKVLKESGKRKLFVIPFLFTFANAFFGFLAVVNIFNGRYMAAAYCILCAALMDLFDGRLARALRSSSYLGMELDSLCDAVSFCFAPAVLVYSLLQDTFGFWGVAVLGLYLCAGLLRLARFNQLSAKGVLPYFTGVPTTIAALFIVQVVIYHQWISKSAVGFFVQPLGLLITVAVLAVLMISPIRYPSFKLVSPRTRFAQAGVVIAAGIVVLSFIYGFPFFFFVTVAYVLSGFVIELYSGIKKVLVRSVAP